MSTSLNIYNFKANVTGFGFEIGNNFNITNILYAYTKQGTHIKST